jgi:hypothetical protein
MRVFARLFVVVSILALGCGGGGGESTVTGTVRHKGKPLGNGYVLLRFDNGNEVNGTIAIDGSGSYTVKTPFTGHAKIAVGSPKPADPSKTKGRGDTPVDPSTLPDPAKWVSIPDKYADPDQSGKETTIKSGTNSLDIDLE